MELQAMGTGTGHHTAGHRNGPAHLGGGVGLGLQDAEQGPPELPCLGLQTVSRRTTRESTTRRQEYGRVRVCIHQEHDPCRLVQFFSLA